MKIKTIEQLRDLASDEENGCDCYIQLKCSVISRKHIRYMNDFLGWVNAELDEWQDELNERKMMDNVEWADVILEQEKIDEYRQIVASLGDDNENL